MLFQRKSRLNKTEYRDFGKHCINPFQGWYRPYIYDLSQKFNPEEQRWCLHEEEPLCLVECSLEAYASVDLPEEALTCLRDILTMFFNYRKQVILRFAYDFEGAAISKEPGNLDRILRHMEQVAAVTIPYHSMVLCYQGLFIGNWGEMHGSRYITDRSMQTLYEGFRRYYGREVILALRRMEWVLQWKEQDKYLTLFDDGIFGSENDLGTYQMDCNEALSLMEKELSFLPVGGEALSTGLLQQLFSKEKIIDSLCKMHLSYLNSQYDRKALSYLNEQGLLDTIHQYMGYRLLVTSFVRTKNELKVTVSNVGWGDLFMPVTFLLQDASGWEICRRQVEGLEAKGQLTLDMPLTDGQLILTGLVRGVYPLSFANHGETRWIIGESLHA